MANKFRHRRAGIGAVAAVAVAALATGVVTAVTTQSQAAAGSAHRPTRYAEDSGRSAGSPAAQAAAHPRTAALPVQDVTLPTGDRVRLSRLPGGQQQATPLPPDPDHPASGSGGFTQFTVGTDQYVVPITALRYLPDRLDIGLFDVSYLARAGLADKATDQVPLVATLAPGATPSLPGLHVAGGKGARRTATLDKAQSWRLGAALRHGDAARRASDTGPLAGIRRLAPAPARPGVAPPPTAHGGTLAGGHGLVRRRLTVHTLDRAGQSAIAIMFVVNADDIHRFFGTWILDGTMSLSVPEGHYLVAANVIRFHPDGSGFDSAFVAYPEVSVGRGGQAVTLDSRTAQPITASVDGQATAAGLISLAFNRRDAKGNSFYFGSKVAGQLGGVGSQTSPLFATPTRPVRIGSFDFQAYLITSPGSAYDPAESHYLLDFPSTTGVPASLAYHVASAALTRVDSRYHWPRTSRAPCHMAQGFTVSEPWTAYGNGYFMVLPPATARTDYLYSPPDSAWFQVVETPACQFYLSS